MLTKGVIYRLWLECIISIEMPGSDRTCSHGYHLFIGCLRILTAADKHDWASHSNGLFFPVAEVPNTWNQPCIILSNWSTNVPRDVIV